MKLCILLRARFHKQYVYAVRAVAFGNHGYGVAQMRNAHIAYSAARFVKKLFYFTIIYHIKL